MRIGSRGTTPLTQQPTRDSANPNAFGAGVGRALSNIGSAFAERGLTMATLAAQERERATRRDTTRASIDLQRAQGEMERLRIDRRTNVQPGAAGFTNSISQTLEERRTQMFSQFRTNYPNMREEDYARLESTWEGYQQGAITSDFAFEIQEESRSIVSDITDLTQESLTRVRQNPAAAQQEYETLRTIAENSNLPMIAMEALDDQLYNQIFSVVFEQEQLAAAQQQTPVRDPAIAAAEGDIVAPGVSGTQRGFLNTLSSVESAYGADSYRVMYGGSTFDDFTDHPRVAQPITAGRNAGRTSSAAGRYQFLASTWDFVRQNMEAEGYDFGPQAFSPVNQDRAALWYAAYRYNSAARQQGLPPELADFNTVLNSDDPAAVANLRRILGGTGDNTAWEGLQNISDEQFAQRLAAEAGRGGTGTSQQPDIWTDPRFSRIPYDDRVQLEARAGTQVDAMRRDQAAADFERQNAIVAGIRERAAAHDPNLFQQVQDSLPQVQDGNLRAQMLQLVSTQIRQGQEAGEAYRAVQGGTALSAGDAGVLDSLYAQQDIPTGIASGEPDAARFVTDTFLRTGQIGPDMLATLSAMTRHSDPQQRQYALDTLGAMYSDNPRAFASLPDTEARSAGILWEQLSRVSGSPARALEQFEFLQDPRNRGVRERLQTEASEQVAEMSADEIYQTVYSGLSRLWQSLPFTQNVQMPREQDIGMLRQDFETAYFYAYTRSGDERVAREYAAESIRTVYAPDPISGTLQYLSPVSPIVAGTTMPRVEEWFEESLYQQFPQLQDVSGLTIIPTDETLQAVRRGQPPTYSVQYTNAQGMIEIGLGEDNQPLQVQLYPTPMQVFEMASDAAARRAGQNLGANVEQFDSFQRDEMGVMTGGGFQPTPEVAGARAAFRATMGMIARDPATSRVRSRAEIIAELREIPTYNLMDPANIRILATLAAQWENAE